jgi:hypothetical protein
MIEIHNPVMKMIEKKEMWKIRLKEIKIKR